MSERIKNNVQTFIVEQLAAFSTPQEIVNAVKEIFGEEISRQLVASYNPAKPSFSAGKKWRVLFYRERESYLSNIKKIPVANQAFRLGVIQRQIERLLSNGGHTNVKLLMALLEQAAREVGGMFTNKREVTITPSPVEQARGLYRELMKEKDEKDKLMFTSEEAMAFVTQRYLVESSQILDSKFLFDSDSGKDS